MLMLLQAHLLRTFVANLKIYTIYALCPESFCDKNLAIRKVFAFSDSADINCLLVLGQANSSNRRRNQVGLQFFILLGVLQRQKNEHGKI